MKAVKKPIKTDEAASWIWEKKIVFLSMKQMEKIVHDMRASI